MGDAVPLQRYGYIQEYVEAGCCGCGGGWRAASVKKKEGNLSTSHSGYTIQDAIYETLAKYLEDELLPLGGPDGFVKTQLCVKASEKKQAPFQLPSRMVYFLSAAQDPALKKHLLTVLWSILPLNLELKTVRNGKRPQHFGQSTGMFGGPQEVILNSNPQAQDFWKKLQALKVRILLIIDKAHVSILPLKNFRLSRFANSSDDLMHKLPSLPRVNLSPVSLYHVFI
jgi:hypothetical protein